MQQLQYTITDPAGIHARPAGLLAKTAHELSSKITIVRQDGKAAEATRLMALMALGIKKGDTITIQAEGGDESASLDVIKALLKEHF